MSVPAAVRAMAAPRRSAAPWAIFLGASVVLAGLLLLVPDPAWYPWALTVLTAIGAGWIAVVDVRTRTLPNRLVAPFAAASALQLVAVAVGRAAWSVLLWGVLAAAIAGALYLLMGLAGWVGFGDVKFAPALALAAAAAAGTAAVWLTPIAIVLGGVWTLIRRAAGDSERRQAHGPALAAGAIVLMVAGVLWPV